MIRLQTILLILVVIAVVIWGGRTIASDDRQATPVPSEVAFAALNTPTPTSEPTATQPLPTHTPQPTAEPTATPEPTLEPTEEPTEEPVDVATERPAPPDTGLDAEALIIDRGDSGRQEIALTFDAGEGAGHTAEILDLLDDYGIKGTFGMTGEWAEQNPELVQRIVDEGHMIINHTYDHKSFTGFSPGTDPLTADERNDEVLTTEQIILDISGYETAPYFRYPYNDYDAASLTELSGIGYDIVAGYTCDTKAWMGQTAEDILAECGVESDEAGAGGVILMHVVQDEDLRAVPMLIEQYQAAGYDFVTFEQIIQP
jgi:peptidoglycan/xylan/chitin deacetylase (PgdA/CDA1 family)